MWDWVCALRLVDQLRPLGLELLNLSFKPLAIPRLLLRRRGTAAW